MALTGKDLLVLMKKQPLGFASVAVAVACLLLYYFRSDKIDLAQAAAEQKAGEAGKIIANVKNSANLAEQTAELLAATKELDARLVRPGDTAGNQQFFYKLEAETGVKMLDVRSGGAPAPTVKGKGLYLAVPFTVSVQGSFKQVLTFLQQLESGLHFCRFRNVTLTKAAAASAEEGGAPAATDLMALTVNFEFLGQP